MEISFHGAARGVTGSCHLVECAGKKILIDCGLYQGGRELDEENARPFGFAPEEIDVLLLTHAHLDHCGRIPLLAKRGFRGEIITTAASRELARLVMLDAAGLEEEEAARTLRRAKRLYTTLDALNAMDYFGRVASYHKPLRLGDGIEATFYDAGHILGSASILLQLEEGGRRRRVLFSGDLGYGGRVILRDPDPPPDADVVVMETTYGDRPHKALQPSIEELYEAIDGTFHRGGNVVIPSFALERAQEVLYYLREGVEADRLPASLQVFLDSPMAIAATEIFRHHPECFDREAMELFENGNDPFDLPGLSYTRETAESIAINRIKGGAVIIAGSASSEAQSLAAGQQHCLRGLRGAGDPCPPHRGWRQTGTRFRCVHASIPSVAFPPTPGRMNCLPGTGGSGSRRSPIWFMGKRRRWGVSLRC